MITCFVVTNHRTSEVQPGASEGEKTMDAERSERTAGFGEAARFGFKRTFI